MPKSLDAIANLLAEHHTRLPACLILSEEDAVTLYHQGTILNLKADPVHNVKALLAFGLPILLNAPPIAFHKDFPWTLTIPPSLTSPKDPLAKT